MTRDEVVNYLSRLKFFLIDQGCTALAGMYEDAEMRACRRLLTTFCAHCRTTVRSRAKSSALGSRCASIRRSLSVPTICKFRLQLSTEQCILFSCTPQSKPP